MKYTEDQIDAYLRGKMTSSEKAKFEAEMEHDSALAREVNLMRLILQGLRDRQEKTEKMAEWEQETDERSASRRVTSPWIPWVTAFSAAAAVLFGVFLFRPTSSPTLPPEVTSPGATMRGGDFSEIDTLIEQGHYHEAQDAVLAEMAEADSLLQESVRIREEADYEVKKYEYALKLLRQKMDEIEKLRSTE